MKNSVRTSYISSLLFICAAVALFPSEAAFAGGLQNSYPSFETSPTFIPLENWLRQPKGASWNSLPGKGDVIAIKYYSGKFVAGICNETKSYMSSRGLRYTITFFPFEVNGDRSVWARKVIFSEKDINPEGRAQPLLGRVIDSYIHKGQTFRKGTQIKIDGSDGTSGSLSVAAVFSNGMLIGEQVDANGHRSCVNLVIR
jgi:hypothetical protein